MLKMWYFKENEFAGVVKLVDTKDLKSFSRVVLYRFESGHRHH